MDEAEGKGNKLLCENETLRVSLQKEQEQCRWLISKMSEAEGCAKHLLDLLDDSLKSLAEVREDMRRIEQLQQERDMQDTAKFKVNCHECPEFLRMISCVVGSNMFEVLVQHACERFELEHTDGLYFQYTDPDDGQDIITVSSRLDLEEACKVWHEHGVCVPKLTLCTPRQPGQ